MKAANVKIRYSSKIRLAAAILFIVALYSYLHYRAYHSLYVDTTFHGIPFAAGMEPDSLLTAAIGISEAYGEILRDRRGDMRNSYCARISAAIEIDVRNSKSRSIVSVDLIDSVKKLEKTVYYSPMHKKIWHREAFKKAATDFPEAGRLVPDQEYDIAAARQLRHSLADAKACAHKGNGIAGVSVRLQADTAGRLATATTVFPCGRRSL